MELTHSRTESESTRLPHIPPSNPELFNNGCGYPAV